ncbi:MAG: histidine--tRNA ligase [Candidatus Lloydbacteria bacterium RIFCSPLOWO2_12_FULL_51_9]|uniref:Histidine--tRNA ligase n=1 Tax=Candidatus Lloydbacteria bacterium RIFCSPLOWO2_12_FULL_51_9 TaxID=1798669 RepID=A0A1G2DW13_9BACT|nr:MAG: histidine--tRNA ligase [Candidatus Lloydbacteria bacterium RIFCSPLOWO2_12_FULL_51_9]
MIKKQKSEKGELYTRAKGMRDITGDAFYALQGFFEKAAEVAVYYGFKPIHTPILEKEALFTSGVGEGTDIVEKELYSLKTKGGTALAVRPEGTAGVMRAYIESGMHTEIQPVMLYYYGPFFRHDQPQRGRYREFFQFGLEVLNTEKSIADALVIHMTYLILREAGLRDLSVYVNSIGDRECRPHYIRELVAYYRKHLNKVCDSCRMRIKENPLRLLDCNNPQCTELKEDAPDIMMFLCSGCKGHFREVLEYLDTLEIPYEIDHTLVRGLDYYTRTVFEITANVTSAGTKEKEKKDEPAGEPPLDTVPVVENTPLPAQEPEVAEEKSTVPLSIASGGRYDYLGERLGSKRPLPSVGVGIGADRVMMSPEFRPSNPRIIKKPKACLIQLGFEAKLKSLSVIEILRKAKIPLAHSLSKDTLSAQLAIAEKLGVTHALIMGKKEAHEGTVIVRNMQSRSQDTVRIDDLGDYLKKNMQKEKLNVQ